MIYSKYIKKFSEKNDKILKPYERTQAIKYLFSTQKNIPVKNLKKENSNKIVSHFDKNLRITTICWNIRHIFYLIHKHINNEKLLEKLNELCIKGIFDSKKAGDNLVILSKGGKMYDDKWWGQVWTTKDEPYSWYIESEKRFAKNKSFNQDTLKLALKILNLKDNIYSYQNIRDIYHLTNNEEIKKKCLIVLWMRFKMDKKTYEYELN